MRALYFRYRRDCLSAAELAFIWRQSTHSLSLSQRSTCNLGLSAKKRPYRSFTHHPRKTTFFKKLVKSMGAIHSAQSVWRFLLTNTSSDLFIPIVALLSPHPSFVSYFLTASFLLPLSRSIVLKRSFTRQKSLVSPDPVGPGIVRLLWDLGL